MSNNLGYNFFAINLNHLFYSEQVLLLSTIWILTFIISWKLIFYTFNLKTIKQHYKLLTRSSAILGQLFIYGFLAISFDYSPANTLPINISILLTGITFCELILMVSLMVTNNKLWKAIRIINFVILLLGIIYLFFKFIILVGGQLDRPLVTGLNLMVFLIWAFIIIQIIDYRFQYSKGLLIKFLILPLVKNAKTITSHHHHKFNFQYFSWLVLIQIIKLFVVFKIILNNFYQFINFLIAHFNAHYQKKWRMP
ncbi:hypothetical protein P344_01140 [Spiroplasma mirum ATCC 29335]|uniref:Uncharacterized protein n=1 Tax=Spiroplasma mirum ATCC 29335 TaxID=838561 RepID=W6AV72_9MOLU|nr:hypothetical protein [Spiroplasma mirum]AHI57594.1 hypothetical protein P344_01140 [Spiroplasma mirum ATCC 29335]